ncbi:MAG: hypothetical protein AB2708_05165 [Candidatus Thiodiazotropha taylori]
MLAEEAGAGKEAANWIGVSADIGVGMVGSFGLAASGKVASTATRKLVHLTSPEISPLLSWAKAVRLYMRQQNQYLTLVCLFVSFEPELGPWRS